MLPSASPSLKPTAKHNYKPTHRDSLANVQSALNVYKSLSGERVDCKGVTNYNRRQIRILARRAKFISGSCHRTPCGATLHIHEPYSRANGLAQASP